MSRKIKILIILLTVVCLTVTLVSCNVHKQHNYGQWTVTKEASCTEKGERERVCLECGEKQTEKIPLKVHTLEDATITQEPDCVTPGEQEGVCSQCGQTVAVEVDALGHDATDGWRYDDDSHWHECSRCSERLEDAAHTMLSDGCKVCNYGHAILADLKYELKSDGTYIVNGLNNKVEATAIIIPDIYEGTAVTEIKASAFLMANKVTTVTIGDNVVACGKNAFSRCGKLEKVVLGGGLTALPEGMFDKCTKLNSVTLPSTVVEVGKYAFRQTALEEIRFSGASINILNLAFTESSLQRIVFDEGVQSVTYSIGTNHPFTNCNDLISVYFSSTVTSINKTFFAGISNLSSIEVASANTRYKTVGGILYNNDCTEIEAVPHQIEGVVSVAEGVTQITASAFSNCKKITQINLPQTVTSVEQNAFASTNLTSMTFPDSVKTISDDVFNNCTELKSVHIGSGVININRMFGNCKSVIDTVTVSEGNTVYKSVNNGILSKDGTKLYFANKQGEIPQGVTSFGDYAFEYHTEITSIVIPEGVKMLARGTFSNCTKLSSISLPQSLVTINAYAFQGCSITQITVPASVKNIAAYAFDSCVSLASVTFDRTIGWQVKPNGSGAAVEVDVTDVQINSENFLNQYRTYNWSNV